MLGLWIICFPIPVSPISKRPFYAVDALISPQLIIARISLLVLSLTIPETLAKDAFCSDKDFVQSVYHPTNFCLISGAIRQYLFYALSFWWLFTFANIWWVTVFFRKGKLLFDNRRKVYLIQSLIAWGCPIIGVVAVVSDVRYSQGLTFPFVCYSPSVPVFYYLLVLPDQLFVGSSCTLLIWICYSISNQVKSCSLSRVIV
jgi:hypothetical protein